jgi:hypothetical protein
MKTLLVMFHHRRDKFVRRIGELIWSLKRLTCTPMYQKNRYLWSYLSGMTKFLNKGLFWTKQTQAKPVSYLQISKNIEQNYSESLHTWFPPAQVLTHAPFSEATGSYNKFRMAWSFGTRKYARILQNSTMIVQLRLFELTWEKDFTRGNHSYKRMNFQPHI